MKLFKSIPELYSVLWNDKGLPEGLSENIVGWRGVDNGHVMIIGEAPGKEEDATGYPFVGRSGKLLDNLLYTSGVSEYDGIRCYFTNIVKQRPPSNRKPSADEISFYLPYVIQEIALVSPKIIVVTGQTAFTAIAGSFNKISSVRGKIHHLGDIPIMPIFHPSYLLRNPSEKIGGKRWYTRMDIETVKEIVENE